MKKGWVSFYRKILDSPVFDNPKILKVFIWCLLKASHTEYKVIIGLKEIILKPGQFIYGRKQAAKELKMAESTVRNYMDFLSGKRNSVDRYEDRELDINSTSVCSIVSIRNWDKYQKNGQHEGQPQDTYNNVNNKELNYGVKRIKLNPTEIEVLHEKQRQYEQAQRGTS